MSNLGDIKKALKRGKYSLVDTNRHQIYRNPLGHEIRLHNGTKISDGLTRNILQEIRTGSTRTAKHTDTHLDVA